jgi:diguanylate cyclase (GGDEF)-like protein
MQGFEDKRGPAFGDDEPGRESPLHEIISSGDWKELIDRLSGVTGFELSILDDEGSVMVSSSRNPFCRHIESSRRGELDCPDSCLRGVERREAAIFRCRAGLMSFSAPIQHSGDVVYLVGRGGFAEFGDLLEFVKTAREHNLAPVPVTMPLSFHDADRVSAISEYFELSLKRHVEVEMERDKTEEKLLRMTSLFDSRTFTTLSRNPQLLYRFILDTIEFVFGSISAAFLLYDNQELAYKPACSIGRLADMVMQLVLNPGNSVIQEMVNTKDAVYCEKTGKLTDMEGLRETGPSYLFPIFIGDSLKAMILILDRAFSGQDMKVMNAFRDYVQLNLENHDLRVAVKKTVKTDEKLAYLADFSNAIASVLNRERLLKILLDKSLQLVNAEQGSLMLLDSEKGELVVEAHKSTSGIVKDKMRLKKGEGIAGKVLETGGSIVVEDIENDPRIKQENRAHYKTRSFISALIRIEDRIAGVLNIADKAEGVPFSEEDLNLIKSVLDSSAIAIERSLLYDKTEELKKLSITDPLTGIYNRRYLNRRLSEEITRYNRYKHPFSFMMLDLDKFKEYNDTFGHIAGDNLLRDLAIIIEKSLRSIDIAARFGGDEFVAIFPQTPKVDAIQITNRLKEGIDSALKEKGHEMELSVSIGLATFPDDASSIMELIEKTDQALYLAKKGGGDKVVYL